MSEIDDKLVEALHIAAKIHREIGGQSALADTIEQAAAALEAAAEGLRAAVHCARVPIIVPGLGSRDDSAPGGGCRNGAGAHDPEQGRSGLPTREPAGEAARVDGGLGGVSGVG